MSQEPAGLLNLAAIGFPVVALVTTIAIDTIDKNSHSYERIFVGTVGGFSIMTGAIGVVGAFVGYGFGEYIGPAVWYTLLSYLSVGFLTVAVMIKEVLVGVNDLRELLYIAGAIAFFLLLSPIFYDALGL